MRIFIVFVSLFVVLFSFSACTSNQEELEEAYSKLSSYLIRLIEADERGEAEEFAESHGLDLIDGRVRVTIVCKTGQVDAATEAARKVGAETYKSYKNWLQALVPINRLTKLAESDSIGFIRRPWEPVEL